MKKIILLISIAFYVCNALAYDFYVGGIYYQYGTNNVSVTYGENKYTGNVVIPESITVNSKNLPVVGILSEAFMGCSDLKIVYIPNTVTDIGYKAFYNCSKLTSVNIPSGMKTIGSSAFEGCYNLSSINLPEGLKQVSVNAFKNCRSLTSVTIPYSSISKETFSGCTGLKSVTFSEKVITIGEKAFSGCTGLTVLVIPETVAEIELYAFENCVNIETLVLKDSSDGLKYNTSHINYSPFRDMKPTNIYLGRVSGEKGSNYYNANYCIDFSKLKVLTIGSYLEYIEKNKRGLDNSTWYYQFSTANPEVIYAKSMPSFSFNNTTKIYSTLYVPTGKKNLFLANDYYKGFFNITEMDIADMWNGDVDIPDDPNPNPDPNIDPNYLKCDVNGDGVVNIADINRIIDAILSH